MSNSPEPLFPLPDQPSVPPPAASYPSLTEPSLSTSGPGTNRRTLLLVVGVVAASVLVVAGVYGTTLGSGDAVIDSADNPGANVAGGTETADGVGRCGTAPVGSLEGARLSGSGLVLDVVASTECSVDTVVSGSSVRIDVLDGRTNVAAGVFDFSTAPALITTDGDSRLTLTYPLGSFWTVPSILSSSALIKIEADADSSSSTSAAKTVSLSASNPAQPLSGDVEGSAAEALRAISDSDRNVVSSSLADRWIPQVSSKRTGLVADSRTWGNADILREHLQMRVRYPSARLIWSGSWSTFSSPDWWVTVVGETYPTGEAANTWCAANQLDRDHCYAKLVSSVHPIDGSTKLQK